MLYHIRDGTYEIKDLSSALLCVVSKMNEGTGGSNRGTNNCYLRERGEPFSFKNFGAKIQKCEVEKMSSY